MSDKPVTGLQRYQLVAYPTNDGGAYIESEPRLDGGWCRSDDVDALLAAKDERIAELESRRVYRALREVHYEEMCAKDAEIARLTNAVNYAKDVMLMPSEVSDLAEIGRLAVEWMTRDRPQWSADLVGHIQPSIDAYRAAQDAATKEGR